MSVADGIDFILEAGIKFTVDKVFQAPRDAFSITEVSESANVTSILKS
jgi:hypothetical protein